MEELWNQFSEKPYLHFGKSHSVESLWNHNNFFRRKNLKKLISMFLVLGLFTACQPAQQNDQGSLSNNSTTQDLNTPTPTTADADPVPVEATTFETDIRAEGLSADQEMDVEKAAEIIKKVVASQEFKDRVLNHTVNGVKTFLNNNGLSNEEIYQKILEAAESDNLAKDNVMELEFELIPQKTTLRTRIYQIISGIKKIFFFLNLFQNTTPAGVAQQLFQQWLGKIGFALPESSSSENFSVQTAVAKIIGELGQKYL